MAGNTLVIKNRFIRTAENAFRDLDMRSRTTVFGRGTEVSGIDKKVAASIQNETASGKNGQ